MVSVVCFFWVLLCSVVFSMFEISEMFVMLRLVWYRLVVMVCCMGVCRMVWMVLCVVLMVGLFGLMVC